MAITSLNAKDKPTLRRHYRTARKRANPRARYALVREMARQPEWKQGARMAFYIAFGAELNVALLAKAAQRAGIKVYVPCVIARDTPLHFARANPWRWHRLPKHALGMHQPALNARMMMANRLDMLLVPLLAVDRYGYRLGMGGGFYDRTLMEGHITKTRRAFPRCVGMAYKAQYHRGRLPRLTTDERLDAFLGAGRTLKRTRKQAGR